MWRSRKPDFALMGDGMADGWSVLSEYQRVHGAPATKVAVKGLAGGGDGTRLVTEADEFCDRSTRMRGGCAGYSEYSHRDTSARPGGAPSMRGGSMPLPVMPIGSSSSNPGSD